MRRRVDAAGQPRDDDQARRGELLAEPPREQAAMGAGVAGADDRHGGMPQQPGVTPDGEHGRRIGQAAQAVGIVPPCR